MKRLIGYAGAYPCVWLCQLFHHISWIKYNGKFLMEGYKLLQWMDKASSKLSIWGYDIQKWSKISGPFTEAILDDPSHKWRDRHELELEEEEEDWIDEHCLKDEVRRILTNPEDYDLI